MPNVLVVTAGKFSDPIFLVVKVKARDSSVHVLRRLSRSSPAKTF